MNWRLPLKRPPGEPFDWYVLWQTDDGVDHVTPRATLVQAVMLRDFLIDSNNQLLRSMQFGEEAPPDIAISRVMVNKFK